MNSIFRFKKMRLYAAYPFAAIYLFLGYWYGMSFSIGVWCIILGLIIRLWAAGFIKKKRELAVAGPYAMVRNPLYLGNFLMGLGFCFFISNLLVSLIYIALFFVFYTGTIRDEELLLTQLFGQEYLDYKDKVPSLFPMFKSYKSNQPAAYSVAQVVRNGEFIRVAATAVVFFALYLLEYCWRGAIVKDKLIILCLMFAAVFGLLVLSIIHRKKFSNNQQ
ncbi:MAG: isoprenylcysteine carboxylmethyltransferase family protein [Candidatus Omnitrophota bacterium]